jgi:hypothetical protein
MSERGEFIGIGGAPRCGKSSVIAAYRQRQLEQTGIEPVILHADAALLELWEKHAGEEAKYPDLMQQVIDAKQQPSVEEWIREQHERGAYLTERLQKRSGAVWDMLLHSQIEQALDEHPGVPVIAEGVALLPDRITQLGARATVRAVFLGNTSPDHGQQLIAATRAKEPSTENWMHRYTDEQIEVYAGVTKAAMWKSLSGQAEAEGFACFDMGVGDFHGNVDRVVDWMQDPSIRL